MQTHPSASRPFLRWPGGKSRLLRLIWRHLPRARRLIEPFIGAGAVTLSAPDAFSAFIVSDANEALIQLWRAVKEPDDLIGQARKYFTERYRSREAYALLRSTFNPTAAALERAALFLYLNKFGFNGLTRFNRAGQFNTPYGNPSSVPKLREREIRLASQRLRHSEIHYGDFSRAMQLAGDGDVVYCDPPYLPLDGLAAFTAYTTDGFGIEDQRRLISEARKPSARGAFVAISNHDTANARSLYEAFDIIELQAYRSISARATKRGRARELLAILGPR